MAGSRKKYNKSLSGKFIIAVLLAAAAILFSWFFTKTTFRKMLGTVNQLSHPNPKLQLVNVIFRDLVQLDQLQRQQALKTHARTYNPFLKESHEIKKRLDSLQFLSAANETQVRQIDSMKHLLDQRDKVFLSYLSLRKDFISNDTLTEQIKLLSSLIGEAGRSIDSSVVTTEKKVITTTIENVPSNEEESKLSFWDRLVGRKKEKERGQVQKLIQEELNIKIDTVAKASEDSIVQKLSDAISSKEADRMTQRNQLVSRQVQLNRSGGLLISRVLSMLQELEDEELAVANHNMVQATELVNSGVERMNLILFSFVIGIVLLAFLFFGDIAKSNRYRKELIAAKEEAEQLEQVKHRFLANMSHELRTPLQAIVGLAEQSKLKGSAGPTDIDTIYSSSRHLLQTVNEVLDYSRIVSGKFNIEQKVFSMDDVLQETVNIISAKATEKGLSFYADNTIAYGNYTGDPFRLKQVLLNLLGNAVKFTSAGSVSLAIATKEFANRTVFTFKIKDTGIGIAAADQERIFSQFEQGNVSSVQNHEGTGLGLSIVKSLIELQKGTITLESTPGAGSVFSISLSYAHAKERLAGNDAVTGVHKGTVWFVDDDVVILNLCDRIMNKYGITHRTFGSANDLLNTPAASFLTTIFVDIRMPEMNGVELCRQLRKKYSDSVKIVALTAQALQEDREYILENGFDAVLVKPFLENELLAFLTTPSSPFDLSVFIKMTGSDRELMLKIAGTSIEETMKDMEAIKKSIEAEACDAIADRLHKLAGRMGQMGALSLSQELRNMETDLRAQTVYEPRYTAPLLLLMEDALSTACSIRREIASEVSTVAT